MTPRPERPLLQVSGENSGEFRVGWLEGKERVGTSRRSIFPRGSIGRAASVAAIAFHKELGK